MEFHNKVMGVPDLKVESRYYYVGEQLGKFKVMSTIFMNDSTDQNRKASNNMFIHEMDANELLDKINAILEGKK